MTDKIANFIAVFFMFFIGFIACAVVTSLTMKSMVEDGYIVLGDTTYSVEVAYDPRKDV